MIQSNLSDAAVIAVEEFDRRDGRRDGDRVVPWLDQGLTILRDSLYLRMHQDVERVFGRDSMLMPVSELKAMWLAHQTIEIFQIAESAATVNRLKYLTDSEAWYLDWLAHLRLKANDWAGENVRRTKAYFLLAAEERRRAFIDDMAHILHESVSAPLVLFRLFPPAVQIVTARAFDDQKTADDLRSQQVAILPSISDCRYCQGRILDHGEQCPKCGNPLWTYEWLTAAD